MGSRGDEEERGPGRGDVSTKSGGGEACPGETNTKALWFPSPNHNWWSAGQPSKSRNQKLDMWCLTLSVV